MIGKPMTTLFTRWVVNVACGRGVGGVRSWISGISPYRFNRKYLSGRRSVTGLFSISIAQLLLVLVVLVLLFIMANVMYILNPYRNVRPLDVKSCSWPNHESTFPKVVHRIWFGGALHEKYQRYITTCKKLNPTWTEKLWNETEMVDFLKTHYQWSFHLYMSYPTDVLRSDLVRYFIMYHFGGVYMDTDVTCTATYESIIAHSSGADVLVGQAWPVGISNNFLMAKKNHPFFYQTVHNLPNTRNESYFVPYFRSLMTAGTIFIHKNYINYPCKEQIFVVPEKEHKRGWLLHDGEGSWQKKDGKFILLIAFYYRKYLENRIPLVFFVLAVIIAVLLCLRKATTKNAAKIIL